VIKNLDHNFFPFY